MIWILGIIERENLLKESNWKGYKREGERENDDGERKKNGGSTMFMRTKNKNSLADSDYDDEIVKCNLFCNK